MELILDTANLNDIKDLYTHLCIDGVTTNPSIVSKEGKDFEILIKEIDEIIGQDTPIHAQVVSTKFEEMIEEALFISGLRKNMYVKIPVTKDGLKAIKELKKQGIKITATAIFTAHQGFLAAKAGADYVAPYVNRLDNISADGISVVSDLVSILNVYNMKTKVLAASFKNCQQVLELMKSGVHSVTVPADICSAMMNHPLTNWSVDKFTEDWYGAFGEDTTTKKK
ncbi:MAG TPA: fructose-6-phosphate aldolase [Terrisporobacter glycolicus]|uniref:fructose-6-phosphate aldolase n=1 Tax=Terrisporobacter TaxID=1505652 RepID=UPI000E7E0455|nr:MULTISPECIES: fructose-6-phosphate aldolase [Terrisporobacter]MBN9648729.1 fructose-6-phosphate aldolase [Terrisporobacter glycolicus]HBI94392.1 fructose-6-phosphate aldolase [Terrisporobacter hibernicus]